MPLFKTKTPGNASGFNGFLIEIAGFDIIDPTILNNELFYLPEDEAYTLSFLQAGFESIYMMFSMGFFFYIFLVNTFLIICSIPLMILAKKCSKVTKVSSKLTSYLYWNGLIRLLMEAYLDVSICTLINLKRYFWIVEFNSLTLNNLLVIFFAFVLIFFPPFLLIFAACKHNKWQSEEYQNKYGTLTDGTTSRLSKHKWLILFIPFMFFLRRIILALTVVFWNEFFFGQISFQFAVSTIMIIFI